MTLGTKLVSASFEPPSEASLLRSRGLDLGLEDGFLQLAWARFLAQPRRKTRFKLCSKDGLKGKATRRVGRGSRTMQRVLTAAIGRLGQCQSADLRAAARACGGSKGGTTVGRKRAREEADNVST